MTLLGGEKLEEWVVFPPEFGNSIGAEEIYRVDKKKDPFLCSNSDPLGHDSHADLSIDSLL